MLRAAILLSTAAYVLALRCAPRAHRYVARVSLHASEEDGDERQDAREQMEEQMKRFFGEIPRPIDYTELWLKALNKEKARLDWARLVMSTRQAERERFATGQRLVSARVAELVSAERGFVEREWAREAEKRQEAKSFVADEWDRENQARDVTRDFIADEWGREKQARDVTREFIAGEVERLQEADAGLAARLRGAPELSVCVANISCGPACGELVAERLSVLAESTMDAPAPIVRRTTKCSGRCRIGKVAISGLPQDHMAFCDTTDLSRPPRSDDDKPQRQNRLLPRKRPNNNNKNNNDAQSAEYSGTPYEESLASVDKQLAKILDRCRPEKTKPPFGFRANR